MRHYIVRVQIEGQPDLYVGRAGVLTASKAKARRYADAEEALVRGAEQLGDLRVTELSVARVDLPDVPVEQRERRKGRKVTREELEEVASVYKAAKADWNNPTACVAAMLEMPWSTASKRVMLARRAGLIDPMPSRSPVAL